MAGNLEGETTPRRDAARVCAWAESVALAGVEAPLGYAWRPERPVAVLGLAQQAERELHLKTLEADGIPVLRRSSGGGAVLLGEGVLCWGLFAPPAMFDGRYDIHGAFRRLTEPLIEACRHFGVAARLAGISDIAAPSDGVVCKIAGCAQLRKRAAVLVHGSLLVCADTSLFARYLAFPSEIPEYRASRSHADFCRTLQDLSPAPVNENQVAACLRSVVEIGGWGWTMPPAELNAAAQASYEAKYSRAAWNFHHKRK